MTLTCPFSYGRSWASTAQIVRAILLARATAATCRIPRGQHAVGLITGQNTLQAIEAELAAETLKLAAIREIKSRRFRRALIATIVFYTGVVISLLLLRNCGAGGDSWACRY